MKIQNITHNELIPAHFNLAKALLDRNASDPEKTLFIEKNRITSYACLLKYVQQLSQWLQIKNIQPEQRIILLLPDCLEFVVVFLGAIWSGILPVMINEAAKDKDIEYMILNSRAKLVITYGKWQHLQSIENLASIPFVLIDDNYLFNLLEPLERNITAQNTHRDEPCFWVYTSGSTGAPKAVIHAHYSPIVACENYGKQVLKITEKDRVYSAACLAFSYGLGVALYMPMYFGATAILSSTNNAFEFYNIIETYRPTLFFAIPHIYALMFAVKDSVHKDFSSLRLCISAGEQLPKSLWHKWTTEFALPLCEGIGTTESMHIFISNQIDDCTPGSSGKQVPGYSIRLVDEQGDDVAVNEVGALEVTGEGFFLGYWNRLTETKNYLSANTLKTGDKFYCDANGNYYYVGRKDQLFKINGMWILPNEIEDVLLQHKMISDAAVIPAAGTIEDTIVIYAFIVISDKNLDKNLIIPNIRKFLIKHLPKAKIPKKIIITDKIPRTSTGKINRKLLIDSIPFIKVNEYDKAG